jgi:hypothetical protein
MDLGQDTLMSTAHPPRARRLAWGIALPSAFILVIAHCRESAKDGSRNRAFRIASKPNRQEKTGAPGELGAVA